MRFYHCFYTDLPDEFVEAYKHDLVDLARCSSLPRLIMGGVYVNNNRAPVGEPYLTASKWFQVHEWMQQNKGKYSGGYWKSLTPDQRDPHRATGQTGGGYPIFPTVSIGAGQVALTAVNAGPSLMQQAPYLPYGHQGLAQASLHPAAWSDVTPARPALKREMAVGEIVGYRCWRIENGRWLRSVYQKDIWYPGKVLEGRELEDWGQRGVHAWKEPNSSRFLEYLTEYLSTVRQDHWPPARRIVPTGTAMVTGSVLLWGDVVEHEHGYRGEFAKIKSLDWLYPSVSMMGRERDILDGLRKDYSV